jgi:hypothetical protein
MIALFVRFFFSNARIPYITGWREYVVPPPRPQIINHFSFILSQPYLIFDL